MSDPQRRIVRDGYDAMADEYLGARVAGGDVALLPELVTRLPSGSLVLDAGCGAGVPVMPEIGRAGLRLVGLDLSGAQLRLARSLVAGTDLVQADLAALPFRHKAFAGVVSYYAVIHVPRSDHPKVFAELRRVLRPRGIALLCLGAGDVPEDDDPESWLGTPMFWSHFDAATNLELLAEAGFEILRHDLVTDPMDHGRHLFALVSRGAA